MSDTPKQDRNRPQSDQPAGTPQNQQQDQGGEATLTEQEERRRGGENKQTPGPIYDV